MSPIRKQALEQSDPGFCPNYRVGTTERKKAFADVAYFSPVRRPKYPPPLQVLIA
jgi:hypothetical protein